MYIILVKPRFQDKLVTLNLTSFFQNTLGLTSFDKLL